MVQIPSPAALFLSDRRREWGGGMDKKETRVGFFFVYVLCYFKVLTVVSSSHQTLPGLTETIISVKISTNGLIYLQSC